MTVAWSNIFENYGSKRVTRTDKAKGAYVPNASQCRAIAAAGIAPSTKRPADEFKITLLDDPKQSVAASFYHSIRETNPTRTPEPRMGHAFISSWLTEGDLVVIGNIGNQLFALKDGAVVAEEELTTEIASKADKDIILALAKKAKGPPARKTYTRQDYQRNIYVVMGALIRSGGKCEMPECDKALFFQVNGAPYLEVHHVVPLGEHGDDTLANASALCPHCHRELHFGRDRIALRAKLSSYIASL